MSSGLGADPVIGVLGGGQLGRMLAEAAGRLGLRLHVLDPGGGACAAALHASAVFEGSFRDPAAVEAFAQNCDIITVEIEHVAVDALEALEKAGKKVIPSASVLRVIADKALQKETMREHGVPVIDFLPVPAAAGEVAAAAAKLGGFPLMLKARREAYDGRGNFVVKSAADAAAAVEFLGGGTVELYAERWAPFKAEVSVIVAVGSDGAVVAYDAVETRQEDNICRIVVMPPSFAFSGKAAALAKKVASNAVRALGSAGIFAVEMFYMDEDTILVNEIAPRPHNSGHITIEACATSQYEQHLRILCGLPLGAVERRVAAAAMINILGSATADETTARVKAALVVDGASVHWYGKTPNRLGRKHGHITVTAPGMSALASRLNALGESLGEKARPVVGVIMGSDSDLPPMRACAEMLERFGVEFELTVVSAHRTPDRMFDYAKAAAGRGIKVIIAAAGGAAHLPGMVAALTPLPVIGVPIKTSTLNGQDSLLSIVQMPRGVPVATVAIGNSTNAAILAVRFLAVTDDVLAGKLDEYHTGQSTQVEAKAAYLEKKGFKSYLDEGGVNNIRPYIDAAFDKTLDASDLSVDLEKFKFRKYKGKVRDCYFGEKMSVLIATDRLSGFDRSLGVIPFKGSVLNLISLWWFDKTKHIVANHVMERFGVVHQNVCIARKCKPFPIEFVVRGYLTGSTSTSIWTAYNSGKRSYCGHALEDGMVKNQKLPKVICTPTTKSEVHDMPISGEDIVKQKHMSRDHWEFCEAKALELFKFGQQEALKHGMLLVDTKYEFGVDEATGEVLLIDEIHTPDSSRYWIAETYDQRMKAGQTPEHIDKEFVRLWFREHCDPYKDEVLPSAPKSLLQELSFRYLTLYEKITGQKFPFKFSSKTVNEQVSEAITNILPQLQ